MAKRVSKSGINKYLRKVAYHEAGHAVVAHLYGRTIEEVEITFDISDSATIEEFFAAWNDLHHSGITRYAPVELSNDEGYNSYRIPHAKDICEKVVQIKLAGQLAERRYKPKEYERDD